MAHVRHQIRDALVTALTGLTTTGANVFRNRVYPIATNKFPALLIYTDKESSERITMGGRYDRTMTVNIECLVTAGSDYDEQLDLIASEVEVVLAADLTLGGIAEDMRFVSYETDYSDQGDKPLARGAIAVEVDYQTIEGFPDTPE